MSLPGKRINMRKLNIVSKEALEPMECGLEAHGLFSLSGGLASRWGGLASRFFILLLLCFLLVGGCVKKSSQSSASEKPDVGEREAGRADSESKEVSQPSAKAKAKPIAPLSEMEGVKVLVLEGDAQKRGRLQGTLLKEEIRRIVKKYVYGFLYSHMGGRSIVRVVAESAEEFISEEMKTEMKAMAEAAGVSYKDILVLNAHVDSLSSACSTVGVTAKATSAKPLLARNLDWPAPPDLNGLAVFVVVRTPGKKSYANYTYPGFLGVLTGLNSKGVAVSMNVSASKDAARLCTPTPLILRDALQKAKTAQEFLDELKTKRRCSGFIITALDARSGAGVIEYTASKTSIRKPVHEVLASTNHFLSSTMKKLQMGSTKNSRARLKVLRNAATFMEGTPLGLDDLKGALNKAPVFNSRTLMSVIVSPAEGWFDLWQRGDEASSFRRIQAKKLLSGEVPVIDALPMSKDSLKDLD